MIHNCTALLSLVSGDRTGEEGGNVGELDAEAKGVVIGGKQIALEELRDTLGDDCTSPGSSCGVEGEG